MKMGRVGGGGYLVQVSEASCQQAEWIADRNYYVAGRGGVGGERGAYLGKQGQNQIIDSWRGIWCELIISPFHSKLQNLVKGAQA
jgi:hypothetical protein